MKHQSTKHEEQSQEQTAGRQQTGGRQSALEFANAEEMLRHDANQTTVPPAVADRIQKSVEQEPVPARSWWQRLFSRK